MKRHVSFCISWTVLLLTVGPFVPGAGRVCAGTGGTWYDLSNATDVPTEGIATAFDSRRGRQITFGGYCAWIYPGGVSLGDVDKTGMMSVALGGRYEVLAVGGGPPPKRFGAGAAYDSLTDRVYLFGGKTILGTCPYALCVYYGARDDLWELDLWSEPPLWRTVGLRQAKPLSSADGSVTPARGAWPAGRGGHSMIVDPIGRRLVLYGGEDSLGVRFDDLWIFPLDGDRRWHEVVTAGPGPGARSWHNAIYDPIRRRMVVIGGSDDAGERTDAWSLDLEGDPAWSPLAIAGTPPTEVAGATYDSRRDRVLVLARDATWEVPLASPVWTLLVANSRPGTSAIDYDPRHDVVYTPDMSGLQCNSYPSLLVLPGPRVELAPTLESVTYWHGSARLRWDLHPSGPFSDPLLLERATTPSYEWAAVDTTPPEEAVEEFPTLEDPTATAGILTRYRLAWTDPPGLTHGTYVTLLNPPGPISMSAVLDSLYSLDSHWHIQWTLEDDSLSWLARAVLERFDGSWQEVGPVWPDSLRRVSAVDPVPAFGSVAYRLRWPSPLGDRIMMGAQTPAMPLLGNDERSDHDGGSPWPNPVRDVLFVPVSTDAGRRASIGLFDISGRRVCSLEATGGAEHAVRVPVAGLAPGVYLLRTRQGGRSRTDRILVIP